MIITTGKTVRTKNTEVGAHSGKVSGGSATLWLPRRSDERVDLACRASLLEYDTGRGVRFEASGSGLLALADLLADLAQEIRFAVAQAEKIASATESEEL